MTKPVFQAADILLPDVEDMENWAVIACDQFSSDPQYWDAVEKQVGALPSTFHLILPEAWLESEKGEAHQKTITQTMKRYLDESVFKRYPDSMIYVLRQLQDGSVRKGLVGLIDLEDYDFNPESKAAIKATEQTILERIPPRRLIRSQALVELPHVLLLANDEDHDLLDFQLEQEPLYDFDLMQGGGHIQGYLVQNKDLQDFYDRLEAYADKKDALFFVVGDGNHSLAAAKSYWDSIKANSAPDHPARYALVELENIHDPTLVFEPIHRVIKKTDVDHLIETLRDENGDASLDYFVNGEQDSFPIDSRGRLLLSVLQEKLDDYLKHHPGQIDYIHGEEDLLRLSLEPGSVGILLPAIDKKDLFEAVAIDGVLPRKTFSMGHAREKRYYLEARELTDSE